MPKTWNVCMMGMGYWSDVHFGAWLSLRDEGVRIEAISDRNQHKLDAKAERYGLPADRLFLRLDDALTDPRIDIVDVITRPDSHLEMVERAANAGKHVLCQKPFAPTIEECRRMVEICSRRNVRLMVAEGWRWQAHYMKIREIVNSGVLGAISYVKLSAKWFYTPRFHDPAEMNQPYFRTMERLLMYEMSPHYIDAYRSLFGLPDSITAVYKRISPHIRGDDLAILVFHHPEMTGLLELSWASREHVEGPYNQPRGENLMEYMCVEGEKAMLRLNVDGTIQIVYAADRVEDVDYAAGTMQEAHNRLHAHFIDGLRSGRPFVTSGEQYLQVMKVIEKAYETGGRVDPLG